MRDVRTLKHALRLLREERGFSQLQVAEALGVNSSMISAWESGDRKPSFERIFQLADLFDLDLGDLDHASSWPAAFRGDGPPPLLLRRRTSDPASGTGGPPDTLAELAAAVGGEVQSPSEWAEKVNDVTTDELHLSAAVPARTPGKTAEGDRP